MSSTSTDSGHARMVSRHVPHEENRYRWHVLRYVRACRYPASIGEIAAHVAPRVGDEPAAVESTLEDRDLPALADCGAIEYDPESRLAWLPEDEPFADRVRRALAAGRVSHLRPPRLERFPRGVSEPVVVEGPELAFRR